MSDHADTIRRDVQAARDALIDGTPERYPNARASVRILDAEALLAERQQAIDALREVARTDGSAPHKARIARAALLKLGEQP